MITKMNRVLIIPAASWKDEYNDHIPEIFKMNDKGLMNIINNINGLPLREFDHIYFIINKRIDNLYHIKSLMETALKNIGLIRDDDDYIYPRCNVLIIDKTKNVIDTILTAIDVPQYINFNNDTNIFIKDADGFIEISDLNDENTVYTYTLESVININPSSKSYVQTTADDIILNIIEKRVIGNEFCAGGYYFTDIRKFIELCRLLNNNNYESLYLSNLIFFDILNNNELYRAEQVIDFKE